MSQDLNPSERYAMKGISSTRRAERGGERSNPISSTRIQKKNL
jgi:hypothetical protein